MKTSFKNALTLGLLLVVSAGLATYFTGNSQPKNQIWFIEEGANTQEAVLEINDGQSPLKSFEAQIGERTTAFDLLKSGVKELGLALESKSYDIGVFIETIGNVKNGEDGKYWMYYVNGTLPMVAADKTEIKPGDKVEFKFEKSSF
ncbi:MAG: DUF4430 domain-containing protein [bacterium]|nr:DUF4430 domain-containing protein [bacterium]